MSERRDKSNKKFMLLSAIGIFMVVDHHTFTAFNFFGNVLPYDSFYMPMFVLISGYFNKVDSETNLWTYFLKKLKTLLVPYAGISLAAFAIQQLINRIKLGSGMAALPSDYLSYVLKRIVTIGAYGEIVEPMWFVITLFATLMVYALLRKFLSRFWNSFVMFALFCGLHLFVVYYAKSVEAGSITYLLVPLKCMFFLPFLELGAIYRKYLEKKHSLMPGGAKIAVLFGLLLLNMVRTLYLPNAYDVAFDSIDNLSGFTSPYIVTPLVSSIIGICFWLTFVELVGKQVAESRFVNFMSCNTFWIMGLHILFFNILNCVLMEISLHITEIRYFDVEAFRDTEWYFWGISDTIKMLYVLVGITGPLALKWCFERIAAPVNGLITRKINLPAKKAVMRGTCSTLAYILPLALTFGILFGLCKARSGQEPGPGLPGGGTETSETPDFDPFEGIVVTFMGDNGSGTADLDRDSSEPAIPMSIEYRIDKARGLSNGDVVTVYAFSDYESAEDAAEEIAEMGYNLKADTKTYTVSGLAESGDAPGGDPETPSDDPKIPASSFLDIVYEQNGEEAGYYTEMTPVKGDGTYTLTLSRSKDEDVLAVFDSLSYMGIGLNGDQSEVDVSAAEITEIKVRADDVSLIVSDIGTQALDEQVKFNFFDCYDPSAATVGDDGTVEGAPYDFGNTDVIEVTFSVSGTKKKAADNPGDEPGQPAESSERRIYIYYNGEKTEVNRYLLLLEKMPDDKETMIALLTEYTHIGKAEAQTFVYSHVNMTETAVIYETEDSTEACRIRKAFEAAGAEISVFHAE